MWWIRNVARLRTMPTHFADRLISADQKKAREYTVGSTQAVVGAVRLNFIAPPGEKSDRQA